MMAVLAESLPRDKGGALSKEYPPDHATPTSEVGSDSLIPVWSRGESSILAH